MATIVFKVQSTRIGSIDLPEGATVATALDKLAEAGLDVSEAEAVVHRVHKGAPYAGDPGAYVLRTGDAMELSTYKADLEALKRKTEQTEKEIAVLQAEAGRSKTAACKEAGTADGAVKPGRKIPVSVD